MVRYYGYYSNVSRGKRQMAGKDDHAQPHYSLPFFDDKYPLTGKKSHPILQPARNNTLSIH